jgi:hypothetical protein
VASLVDFIFRMGLLVCYDACLFYPDGSLKKSLVKIPICTSDCLRGLLLKVNFFTSGPLQHPLIKICVFTSRFL